MSKRLLIYLQYILFLGGGLFLVWWQLKGMSVAEEREFYSAINNANYWMILPVALMSIVSHIARSMRWQLLMEPMGYKTKLSNVFSVTMIGYLANAAIPRLGELLKCTILAKYEKLKIEKLVGTIIVERGFDMICYLLFIGLTVLIQIGKVSSFVESKFTQLKSSNDMFFWLKLILILITIYLFVKLVKLSFKKYPENKFIQKTKGFIDGLLEGLNSIKQLKKRKQFIALTLLIWAMYLGQIYIGFMGMKGTSMLDITAACSVLTLATLSMIVTPGGIGSFPIFVMQTLLIYGIPATMGKAFGWMMWGVSTGIMIIVGLTCLALIPYLNKSKTVHINS